MLSTMEKFDANGSDRLAYFSVGFIHFAAGSLLYLLVQREATKAHYFRH